jgi:hypothetical protein
VNGSLSSYALWRCGPVITAQGRQDSSQPIQLAMMVDGLDGDSAGQAFQASTSDSKSFTFNLALKGLSTRSIPARVKAVCVKAVCVKAVCVKAVCVKAVCLGRYVWGQYVQLGRGIKHRLKVE